MNGIESLYTLPTGEAFNKFSFVLNFLRSDDFQYFLPFLSNPQREAVIMYLEESNLNEPAREVFFRVIIYNEPVAKKMTIAFYHAIDRIFTYLFFVYENNEFLMEGSLIFTRKTAPYFWKDRQLGKNNKMEVILPDSLDIAEYILQKLSSLEFSLIDYKKNIAPLFVRRLNGMSIHDIANDLSMDERSVCDYFEITINHLKLLGTSVEDLVIEFFTLSPIARQVVVLSNRHMDTDEIASTLGISRSSVRRARSNIDPTIGFKVIRSNKFRIGNINLGSLSQFELRYVPENGFIIEQWTLDEMVSHYLETSNSFYKQSINQLLISGEWGLIYLYFLLCEVPNSRLISKITSYSTISLKIKKLKDKLLPPDHPARKTKSFEDWVEITDLGRRFLLDEEDWEILNEILKLGEAERAPVKKVSEQLNMPLDTVSTRIKKMKKLFNSDIPKVYDFAKMVLRVEEG